MRPLTTQTKQSADGGSDHQKGEALVFVGGHQDENPDEEGETKENASGVHFYWKFSTRYVFIFCILNFLIFKIKLLKVYTLLVCE